MKNIFDLALNETVDNSGDITFVFTVGFNDESYEVNFQYEGDKVTCINQSGGDIGDCGLMKAIEDNNIDYSNAVDFLDEEASELV